MLKAFNARVAVDSLSSFQAETQSTGMLQPVFVLSAAEATYALLDGNNGRKMHCFAGYSVYSTTQREGQSQALQSCSPRTQTRIMVITYA